VCAQIAEVKAPVVKTMLVEQSVTPCFDLPEGGNAKMTCGAISYASPSRFGMQVCFSKSSCASRLKASAATVLSSRGAVMPQVQCEQHQPLKSSPSTQMRCLFMDLHPVIGL
jgi:hypothetical protein